MLHVAPRAITVNKGCSWHVTLTGILRYTLVWGARCVGDGDESEMDAKNKCVSCDAWCKYIRRFEAHMPLMGRRTAYEIKIQDPSRFRR